MLNILKKFSWLKRISIMVIMAQFTLLWGEVYTRILVPQDVDSKMNIYADDPVIGFTFKPNASTYEKGREYNALYQINSLGLRDREYGPKQEGIFRALLLGDSFSVSHGLSIENSLSRQMERALQEVADRDGGLVKFEVINAAAGGYSPYNYWKAYLRWAPVFDLDMVIVGWSPDDYNSRNAELNYLIEEGDTLATYRDGHAPKEEVDNYIRNVRKWLSWNSEFYILLRNFLYYNDLVGRLYVCLSAKGEDRVIQLQQFMIPQPESITQSWKTSFSYLNKLHEATTNDSVPLLIISIPSKDEIDYTQFQRTLKANGLNQSQIDINQPLNEISNYCSARNIPFFDPRPAIKARHMEVPCYFVYDGHWIAEGIRVAMSSVVKQWRNWRLPPWDKHAILNESQRLN
jgi:hypothetical protein